jgi:protein-tyrosine phosphatase
MFGRVLILCAGNVCRSPMAEAELAHRLATRRFETVVESAGISALVGSPAEPIAQELMLERGIDLSRHRARQVTPDMIRSAELVLVMDEEQQRAAELLLPSARGRVHRLGRWGGFDIPDPYRRDRATFARSLALIVRGIDSFEKAFWPETRGVR